MEATEKLFLYLGEGIHTNFEGNRLKYKHIFIQEGKEYMQELNELYDDFRIEFKKHLSATDAFDLLARITDTIDTLTNYYYDEVIFYKSQETELPELAEYEQRVRRQYRDNQLHLLEPVIKHEIKIAKKAKRFIIEKRQTTPASVNSSTNPLKERILFEGDQITLITLFHSLQLIKKLTFNKTESYSTEQKHFEDFLQNYFSYRSGTKYVEVKNVAKALADLRQQYGATADDAKKRVMTMIDATIVFLNTYKADFEKTSLKYKETIGKNTE